MLSLVTVVSIIILAACSTDSDNTSPLPVGTIQPVTTGSTQPGDVPPFPTESDSIVLEESIDGGTIQVREILHEKEQVFVFYVFRRPGEPDLQRILKIHEAGANFLVYTGEGELLGGYTLEVEESGRIVFALVGGPTTLGIEAHAEWGNSVRWTLKGNNIDRSVTFATESDMDRARDLLWAVETGRINPSSLSPENAALLDAARELQSWAPDLPFDINADELQAIKDISEDPAVVGPSDSHPGDPGNATIIELLCKVIKLVKRVCDFIGNNTICEFVDILNSACDLIHDMKN